jgi:glycosylphosphatidylinositol transamidase (GPIT) subunit GPI8
LDFGENSDRRIALYGKIMIVPFSLYGVTYHSLFELKLRDL